MIISFAALSDIGRIRAGNEDSFLADEKQDLFVVADGMGGCQAGAVASRMAVVLFQEDFASGVTDENARAGFSSRTTARLAKAVACANRGVYQASRSKDEWTGMGTTIAAVSLDGDRLSLVHVGDSRIYLVRGHSLIRLTEDHSYVQEQRAAGAIDSLQADHHPLKHVLTRAIGPLPEVAPETAETDVMGGDRLLLCSDGLTTTVSDEELYAVVSAATDPAAACRQLVDLANERGGEDNITVVTVFLADDGYLKRFIRWIRRY